MDWRFIFIFIVFSVVIAIGESAIYQLFKQLGFFKINNIRNIYLSLSIVLPTMFIVGMVYGAKHFSLLNSWLYTAGAIWLGVLLYLFLATVIAAIIILINNYLGLNLPIKNITFILMALALGVSSYGLYNASSPRIVHWQVSSSDLYPLWQNKKIVIVSDIHLGDVRRQKFMQKIVDIIKAEKPDIVFNLGDIIDGPAFPYALGFAPLLDLNPTLGNYYVEGNHERYNAEYPIFKASFPVNLNDITNKKVIINGTQIIGLPYNMFGDANQIKKELETVSYDENMPSIILMHDPKQTPTLAQNNVSLVLSGHTHMGQLLPMTFLLQKMYGKYVHGVTYTNNTASVTSSGVGTAMPPMRIGTNPEIIILTITK